MSAVANVAAIRILRMDSFSLLFARPAAVPFASLLQPMKFGLSAGFALAIISAQSLERQGQNLSILTKGRLTRSGVSSISQLQARSWIPAEHANRAQSRN
jgi:hypothetical protein